MPTLYHYTTEAGARGIKRDGFIKPSTGGTRGRDTNYGVGVYLTSKSPHNHSMVEISMNNYDGRPQVYESRANMGKVRIAFEFTFDDAEVQNHSSARDVWVYTGGKLYLESYGTGNLYVPGSQGYRVDDWYMQVDV